MSGGYVLDLLYVHQVGYIPDNVGARIELGNALRSQRGVGGHGHVLGLAEVHQVALLQVDMVLDLVVGRPDLAVLKQTGHLILAEVRHANGLGQTLLHQRLHCYPDGGMIGGHIHLHQAILVQLEAAILVDVDGEGGVDQVQIHIVQLQIGQRLPDGGLHLVGAIG